MVTFWTLPLISPVAAACCSTAAAIAVATDSTWLIATLT